MGNDSGDIGQLPDFNPAVVDEQLAAWSHVNGLTTNKDPSNIPAFVLLHRARSALSCIQRALRSHGIVSTIEFAIVWYFLRPMLVRIEELDHGALAEDAPLREYICALGVHDQDPQSLRTFLCQNGWPQKQSVSDLGIERVGLGPLQWWRPLEHGHRVSVANVHLWEAAQRGSSGPVHGLGSGRVYGHETRPGLGREGNSARVDVLGVDSAGLLFAERNDHAAVLRQLVSEAPSPRPEPGQNSAEHVSWTLSQSAVPLLRDYVEQDAAQMIDLVRASHSASQEPLGRTESETDELRPGTGSLAGDLFGTRDNLLSDSQVFRGGDDTNGSATPYCAPASEEPGSIEKTDTVLIEAVDHQPRITIPRTILEQPRPPLAYGPYVINMQHPPDSNADWSISWRDQERARLAILSRERLPDDILWSLPAINGLPTPPLEYRVRCERCTDRQQSCWFQGSASCTQCCVAGLSCSGGSPPQLQGDMAAYLPEIERRQAMVQRLGQGLYQDVFHPNGLLRGQEYRDPTCSRPCFVVAVDCEHHSEDPTVLHDHRRTPIAIERSKTDMRCSTEKDSATSVSADATVKPAVTTEQAASDASPPRTNSNSPRPPSSPSPELPCDDCPDHEMGMDIDKLTDLQREDGTHPEDFENTAYHAAATLSSIEHESLEHPTALMDKSKIRQRDSGESTYMCTPEELSDSDARSSISEYSQSSDESSSCTSEALSDGGDRWRLQETLASLALSSREANLVSLASQSVLRGAVDNAVDDVRGLVMEFDVFWAEARRTMSARTSMVANPRLFPGNTASQTSSRREKERADNHNMSSQLDVEAAITELTQLYRSLRQAIDAKLIQDVDSVGSLRASGELAVPAAEPVEDLVGRSDGLQEGQENDVRFLRQYSEVSPEARSADDSEHISRYSGCADLTLSAGDSGVSRRLETVEPAVLSGHESMDRPPLHDTPLTASSTSPRPMNVSTDSHQQVQTKDLLASGAVSTRTDAEHVETAVVTDQGTDGAAPTSLDEVPPEFQRAEPRIGHRSSVPLAETLPRAPGLTHSDTIWSSAVAISVQGSPAGTSTSQASDRQDTNSIDPAPRKGGSSSVASNTADDNGQIERPSRSRQSRVNPPRERSPRPYRAALEFEDNGAKETADAFNNVFGTQSKAINPTVPATAQAIRAPSTVETARIAQEPEILSRNGVTDTFTNAEIRVAMSNDDGTLPAKTRKTTKRSDRPTGTKRAREEETAVSLEPQQETGYRTRSRARIAHPPTEPERVTRSGNSTKPKAKGGRKK